MWIRAELDFVIQGLVCSGASWFCRDTDGGVFPKCLGKSDCVSERYALEMEGGLRITEMEVLRCHAELDRHRNRRIGAFVKRHPQL